MVGDKRSRYVDSVEARLPLPEREDQRTRPSAADLARITSSTPRPGGPAWKRRTHFWLRWAHVYISMFSLLVMLFFGLTGITLNHPDWVLGGETVETTFTGVLPAESRGVDGPQFLTVSEFIRSRHDVSGEVVDFGVADDGQGSISYRKPGYAADLFFDTADGSYELDVTADGFLAKMNALHQGRDSGSLWRWIIDISGALLVVIALTGIAIQIFMKKRRFSALTWSLVGAVVTVALIWVTVN